MSKRSIEELMKLLADITGWSDQSLTVHISYMRARVYDDYGDNLGLSNDWGYVVSTTVCGMELRVSSQSKTLEKALENLARDVVGAIERFRGSINQRFVCANEKLKEWEKLHD